MTHFGYRTDVGTLRPPRRMSDGRLVAEAHITRAGVLEYADPDRAGGIRRELRPEREVFDDASVRSAQLIPVTKRHPPQMLDSSNAKKYAVGSTGEAVVRDDDHLKASIAVFDADAIKALDGGDVEVSCGYACEVDETPGVHPVYGKYDAVQKNIRYNHLAVAVGAARAGRTARVRMDAELTAEERNKMRDSKFDAPGKVRDAMSNFSKSDGMSPDEKKAAVKKIAAAAKQHGVDASGFLEKHGDEEDRKDWSSYMDKKTDKKGGNMADKTEEKKDSDLVVLGAAYNEAKKRADSLETRADDAEKESNELRGQVKQLEKTITELRTQIASRADASEMEAVTREKERADAAEEKLAKVEEVFATKVRKRARLEREASAHLPDDFRFDDIDNDQIRRAVVRRLDSSADVSNAVSKDEIKGVYTQLIKQRVSHASSMARVSQIIATGDEKVREDARSEVTDRDALARNAWKKPLSSNNRLPTAAGGKDR